MTANQVDNVKQAVPFFIVSDMAASLRFYVEGLDFRMKNNWVVEGLIRWCWLEVGDAAIMLQQYWKDDGPGRIEFDKPGAGVSICFICRDALAIYRDAKSRGLQPARPFVGNGMWVTSLTDPDGYRLEFESYTDAPEDSVLAVDEDIKTE